MSEVYAVEEGEDEQKAMEQAARGDEDSVETIPLD